MIRLVQRIAPTAKVVTTLTLSWEQRTKSRQRVLLDNGEEAGLLLERGLVLRGGDCLGADDGYSVQIRASLEAVSTVHCGDPLELARICYHLGNRHVDVEISATEVRYLHDHVLDAMVQGLGFQVEQKHLPFEPESGAYGGSYGGHQHN